MTVGAAYKQKWNCMFYHITSCWRLLRVRLQTTLFIVSQSMHLLMGRSLLDLNLEHLDSSACFRCPLILFYSTGLLVQALDQGSVQKSVTMSQHWGYGSEITLQRTMDGHFYFEFIKSLSPWMAIEHMNL